MAAPAWGRKPAWGGLGGSTNAVAKVPLKEGDEECCVCYDAAVSVRFKPCQHKSCGDCVANLRSVNIFKVDPVPNNAINTIGCPLFFCF